MRKCHNSFSTTTLCANRVDPATSKRAVVWMSPQSNFSRASILPGTMFRASIASRSNSRSSFPIPNQWHTMCLPCTGVCRIHEIDNHAKSSITRTLRCFHAFGLSRFRSSTDCIGRSRYRGMDISCRLFVWWCCLLSYSANGLGCVM